MTNSSTEPTNHLHFHDLKDYFLNLQESDLPGHWDLEIGDGIRQHHQAPTKDATPAAITLLVHTTFQDPSIVFIERSHHIGPVQHRRSEERRVGKEGGSESS